MIPKKLHYVWVGGAEIPAKYQAFIENWSRLMPGWEIIRWDETNFDIENSSNYCRQAYEQKRWAFVSDYIRVKVLYDHGGIYLDTDEEMVQSLDCFVECTAFFGLEAGARLQAGVFGCQAKNHIVGQILAYYDHLYYEVDGRQDNTVIGTHFLMVLQKEFPEFVPKEPDAKDLGDGVVVYPSRYFCPDLATLSITKESYTIHRPMGSWLSPREKLKKRIYTTITSIKPLAWMYRKIKR